MDENRRIRESQQVSHWKGKIAESLDYEPFERLEFLSLGLKNIGYRNRLAVRSREINELFLDLQKIYLSTPGHAQFFADELGEAREKTNKPWMDNSYLLEYHKTRDILALLPSPETIRVLGSMLESKEDVTSRDETIRRAIESSNAGGGGLHEVTSPRRLAGVVFHRIGLRNLPEKVSLEWWKKVKAGEIAFSFVGQAVQYRFNPDGSWETMPIVNPPNDAPKPPVFEKSESKPERQAKELEMPAETKKPTWVWIVTTGLLVVGILVWFVGKIRAANGHV